MDHAFDGRHLLTRRVADEQNQAAFDAMQLRFKVATTEADLASWAWTPKDARRAFTWVAGESG